MMEDQINKIHTPSIFIKILYFISIFLVCSIPHLSIDPLYIIFVSSVGVVSLSVSGLYAYTYYVLAKKLLEENVSLKEKMASREALDEAIEDEIS